MVDVFDPLKCLVAQASLSSRALLSKDTVSLVRQLKIVKATKERDSERTLFSNVRPISPRKYKSHVTSTSAGKSRCRGM